MKKIFLLLTVILYLAISGFYLTEKSFSKTDFGNDDPLPVELVYFDPYIVSNGVLLKFGTATETGNYGFDIERSDSSLAFVKIGFVEGSGNSNSPKDYEYLDTLVNMTGRVYYRLKQIDLGGTFEYSDTVLVDFLTSVELIDTDVPENYYLSNAYPNPFNPSTRIDFTIPQSSDIKLEIFNLTGEIVKEINAAGLSPGTYTVSINLNEFVSGTYIVRLVTETFSSTKKMLMLK